MQIFLEISEILSPVWRGNNSGNPPLFKLGEGLNIFTDVAKGGRGLDRFFLVVRVCYEVFVKAMQFKNILKNDLKKKFFKKKRSHFWPFKFWSFLFSIKFEGGWEPRDHYVFCLETLHKRWSFPLRISSVNVTKSGFGHI